MPSQYCIITPLRDRDEHFRLFVNHYNELLPDVKIFVIEQGDNLLFNRAKLFNAAFLEEGHKYPWAIYHDIDFRAMLPLCNPDEVFAFPEQPTHLGTYLEQFNWLNRKKPLSWKESYETFFGGVCALSKFQMVKSGGWSNEIYGWGHEDCEMRQNLINKGFTVHRRKAYFRCEDHPRTFDAAGMKKNGQYLRDGRNDEIDGLDHCKYEVVSREENEKYTKITVHL